MAEQNSKRPILLIVLILAILFSVSCSFGSLQSQMIGRWAEGSGVELEFFKDDTVTAKFLGITFTGDYKCLDDHTIRIDITGIIGQYLGAQTFDVAIDGDTMTLTADNLTFQFVRLK